VPPAAQLTVHIVGPPGESDRTLLLDRAPDGCLPAGGSVRVREWSAANWAGPPAERVLPAEEVYGIVERAHRERRRVTVSLAELRAWLDGRS
jgi:hypothetical protein